MRKFLLALLGLLVAGHGGAVYAQNAAGTHLHQVDAQNFPVVTALLDLYDAQGQFIAGLQPSNLTVLEDGNPLPVTGLSESSPPAQIVVAINPGPALAVRGGDGIERYKRITDALNNWAAGRVLDPFDDLSLVTIAGPIITHARPSEWAVSLTSFQPDFRTTTPNTQSLTIALNTVNEQTPLPGMKRAILFITPHMDDANIEQSLNTFAQQALEARVRIFVWFIDADLYFNTASAAAFQKLAQQTGGSYFSFSGLETLPDPEAYFSPLRRLYSLSYNSIVSTGGEHTLAVRADSPLGQVSSETVKFSIEVQPPNPILVMPAAQITRQTPPDDPFNAQILLPNQQPIEIIVEFPDGHPRPLVRTTLFVDGQIAVQNESEPFNRFLWDLTPYTQSGQHELKVEAVDTLGLSKTSLGFPVSITVVNPPTGIRAFLTKNRTGIAIGSVGLAGAILLVILLSGRLKVKTRKERRETLQRYTDPVTQPVIIRTADATGKQKQGKRSSWKRPEVTPEAPARLVRLRPDGEPVSGNPILLFGKEITLGTDPVQSAHVLDHPSVSPLHASIRQMDNEIYMLVDRGSVAGTWVNYEPVPQEGRILNHGDMIHFGQLMYRFALRNHLNESEPTIFPEAPA